MAKRTRRTDGTFAKGATGNPRGVNQHTSARPRADGRARATTTTRLDGWQSALTGLGMQGRDKRLGAGFLVDEVGWDLAADLWRGDDIAARVIEKPPAEETRQGFDLSVTGKDYSKELIERVTGQWEDLGFSPGIEEARCYERAYGGGAILLGVDDGGKQNEPLNMDKVRAFEWMTPLEARELIPRYYYTNPGAPKFGKPAIYTLSPNTAGTSVDGFLPPRNVEIHESRLIIFPGTQVSRRRMSSQGAGWGDSVLTRLSRVLSDFGLTWASASVLVQEFSQPVFKIKGLAELIAGDKDSVVQGRMQALAFARSVVNTMLIDAEEDFRREQTPVAGLPELLDKFAVRVAAAADMPLTLLFGQSPAGLNATGESDIRFFYDRIRAHQERKLRPAIERVAKIIFRLLGSEPESWSVRFAPLWQPSEKEQADARYVQAQTDQIYIMAGVVSPEEIARSRFGSDEFSFQTQIDFAAREVLEARAPIQIGGAPDDAPPAKPPGDDVTEAEIVDRADPRARKG